MSVFSEHLAGTLSLYLYSRNDSWLKGKIMLGKTNRHKSTPK